MSRGNLIPFGPRHMGVNQMGLPGCLLDSVHQQASHSVGCHMLLTYCQPPLYLASESVFNSHLKARHTCHVYHVCCSIYSTWTRLTTVSLKQLLFATVGVLSRRDLPFVVCTHVVCTMCCVHTCSPSLQLFQSSSWTTVVF